MTFLTRPTVVRSPFENLRGTPGLQDVCFLVSSLTFAFATHRGN